MYIKFIVILFLSIGLIACDSKDDSNPPQEPKAVELPDSPGGIEVSRPLEMNFEVTPLKTGDSIQPTHFLKLDSSFLEKGLTLIYSFRSKEFTQLEMLQTVGGHSKCGNDSWSEPVTRLFKIEDVGNPILIETTRGLLTSSIKPDSEYRMTVDFPRYECTGISHGFTLWMGSEEQKPQQVRICKSNDLMGKDDEFYHLLNVLPYRIFDSSKNVVIGYKNYCGQSMEKTKQSKLTTSTSDWVQYLVHGLLVDLEGHKSEFTHIYDEDRMNGELWCSRDEQELNRWELSDCEDLMMDEADFPYPF